MRVLYLDHTSLVSGAQRALLDLLSALPPSIEPMVMCPEGRLAEMTRELGVEVVEVPGTAGSLRLHPLHTPRAAVDILQSAARLRDVARATGAQVIHANSIRAGLIAGAARLAGAPPTVVHIHDALPPGRSSDAVRTAILSTADAVITISEYTTRNFAGGGSTDGFHMLFNPLDTERFDASMMSREAARECLDIAPDAEVIGLAAQITPWKGQDTAIRALGHLCEGHPRARMLLIGETKFVDRATRFDNRGYERWLRRLVHALGLEDRVEFWGEREDVQTVMRALDVLVAPSWEEPFGRSVIEAMALETAVVATNIGGPAEVIEDGVDGFVVSPHDPAAWANRLHRLLADPAHRAAMAVRGRRKVVALFDRRRYASRVVDVYDDVFTRPSRAGVRGHGVDSSGDLSEALVP